MLKQKLEGCNCLFFPNISDHEPLDYLVNNERKVNNANDFKIMNASDKQYKHQYIKIIVRTQFPHTRDIFIAIYTNNDLSNVFSSTIIIIIIDQMKHNIKWVWVKVVFFPFLHLVNELIRKVYCWFDVEWLSLFGSFYYPCCRFSSFVFYSQLWINNSFAPHYLVCFSEL